MASLLLSCSTMIVWIFLILMFPRCGETREPTIQEVQEVVRHELGNDLQEMANWPKQSRWAVALPRLQVGFRRELRDTVSLSTNDNVSISGGDVFIGPNENDFDQNFNQGTSFDVKALWRLDELIFGRERLAISQERRWWLAERVKVMKEVTQAYFTRKRLIKELKKESFDRETKEKKKMQVDQMTALVDAYTGGWFTEVLQP